MVPCNGHVYAAVSGGRDSMAMLHALRVLGRRTPFSITVLHMDHMLRPQSDKEAAFVQRVCAAWRIPCLVERVDVAKERRKGESLEQAARRIRYAFFGRICGQEGVVAVAHHQQDQAETVLMHLLRGTGLRGLQGMQPKRDWLIRPLLYNSRASIETYIRANRIPYCEDGSNADCRYTRNRIRHRLLPYLQSEFNPQIVPALVRLAQNVGEDEALLQQWTRQAMSQVHWQEQSARWVRMDKRAFCQQPVSIQKRLLLQGMERLGLTEMRQTIVSTALQAIKAGTHARLTPHCQIWCGTWVELCVDAEPFAAVQIAQEGLVGAGGGHIVVSRLQRYEHMSLPANADMVWLDEKALPMPVLTARPRRPGDKIHTQAGTKSVSDLLTDQKVPHGLRDLLPVVCSGTQVIWVPGVVRSDSALVNEQTDTILQLQWVADL